VSATIGKTATKCIHHFISREISFQVKLCFNLDKKFSSPRLVKKFSSPRHKPENGCFQPDISSPKKLRTVVTYISVNQNNIKSNVFPPPNETNERIIHVDVSFHAKVDAYITYYECFCSSN